MTVMTDFTHLLDDTTATAIAAYVDAKPGHRVVGLHDGVMVRDEIIERKDRFDGMGWYAGSDVVKTMSEPYSTVEVILAAPTGRIYAERHKTTLDDFLVLAGVTLGQRAS